MTEAVVDQPIASRATFDPPPPRGNGRAFTLALLAHVLLVLALAWGLRWKKDAQVEAVEAELWSAIAQIAAPKAAPAEPPPPPPVVAPPKPVPQPQPKPAPPVVDDSARQAELALEQQKKEEQARKAQEQLRLQAQRLEQARKAQEQARLQAQRQEQERQRQEDKAQAAAQQAAAEAKAARKKAAAEKAAQQKAQAEQTNADARQQDNIRRALALAAGADEMTGTGKTATNGTGTTPGGTARRNAGPSADYFARIRARVKPNITYPDLSTQRGNPQAEVEVRVAPDGTITSRRLAKSSGVPAWDNAVLRAIDKTQVLPRDVDGRVFNPMTIVFRPQD